MRSSRNLAVAAIVALMPLATTGHAQQPYWQRPRDVAVRPAVDSSGGVDLVRPYRGGGRGFTPEAVPARNTPAHNPYQISGRNYFPGLRDGQGPNANRVGPLCVPGRRAFLMTR